MLIINFPFKAPQNLPPQMGHFTLPNDRAGPVLDAGTKTICFICYTEGNLDLPVSICTQQKQQPVAR